MILVINEVRIQSIRQEIGKIENEQKMCGKFLKNLGKIEEESYYFIKDELERIGKEYDNCKGDDRFRSQLKNKLKERNQLLREMMNDCERVLYEIKTKQTNLKRQCAEKIQTLELEKRQLQMGVMV